MSLSAVWVEKFGDRIGNFGGIDVDVLVTKDATEIKRQTREIVEYSVNAGGFAFGTGNSIPGYVPAGNYRAMIDAVNEYRGT